LDLSSPTRSSTERKPVVGFNPKILIGSKKCPLRLVPPALEIYVAGVMVVGDEKYTRYNWRGAPLSRVTYLEAAKRHVDAALDGEDADPETGLPHEASVAACMGIALDAMEHGNLVDDRDKSGYVPRLLEKVAKRAQEIREEFAIKRATEKKVVLKTRVFVGRTGGAR
jgi:hypothetical protein